MKKQKTVYFVAKPKDTFQSVFGPQKAEKSIIFIKDITTFLEKDFVQEGYPIYIPDLSVLLNYPELIPTINGWTDMKTSFKLERIYLVIPMNIIQELEKISHTESQHGLIAGFILERIHRLLEKVDFIANSEYTTIPKSAIYFKKQDVLLTIFPNMNISAASLIGPPQDDPIGQTIFMMNQMIHGANSLNFDKNQFNDFMVKHFSNITLLTNNHTAKIRARAEGFKVEYFSYQRPIYSGRRETVVPSKLYETFLESGIEGISLEEWLLFLPEEPKLMANEFISMLPTYDNQASSKKDPYYHIGRFDAKKQRIVHLSYYKNLGLECKNEGQIMYAEAITHPDISVIIVTGPAGSGKTFISTIGAMNACEKGQFLQANIIPCSIDVQKTLGALPGDLNEKISPNVAPIKNALLNYSKLSSKFYRNLNKDSELKRSDVDKARVETKKESEANYEKFFNNIPVEAARGLDFSDTFVIYDEFQDQSPDQADMLLKRIGQKCKVVISGDVHQIHQAGLTTHHNGMIYAKRLCHDLPMVAQVELRSCEVVRSDFVKAITARQEQNRLNLI